MAHSQQQAEQLRQAANLVDQAVAAAEHAQGVKAVADAAQADAQAKSGIADMAKVQALSSLHVAGPSQSPPQVPPFAFASGNSDRRNGGNAGGGSNGIVIAVLVVAGVILLCALVAWLAWLTAGKADNSRVEAVHTKVAVVHTVATAAQATATEAKAGVVTLTAEMKDVKVGLAATTLVANEAHTKVNALTPRVDALEKAQAAVNARRTHQPQPRVESGPRQGGTPSAPDQSGSPRSGGKVWLWHPPEASDTNPKACVLSAGPALGLPKRCSSATVDSACPKGTKDQWLLCVGGGSKPTDTGLHTMPGVHFKS